MNNQLSLIYPFIVLVLNVHLFCTCETIYEMKTSYKSSDTSELGNRVSDVDQMFYNYSEAAVVDKMCGELQGNLYDESYFLFPDGAYYGKGDNSPKHKNAIERRWSLAAAFAYVRVQVWPLAANALIAFTTGHTKLAFIFISMCMCGISLLQFLEFMAFPSADTPPVTFTMIFPMYTICTILVGVQFFIALSADSVLVNLESTWLFWNRPKLLRLAKGAYKVVTLLFCVFVFWVANMTFLKAYSNHLPEIRYPIDDTKYRLRLDKVLEDNRTFVLLANVNILMFATSYFLLKLNLFELGDF